MASSPAAFVPNQSERDLRLLARELLKLRSERGGHFPLDVTGPAWDLLLALFHVGDGPEQLSLGELVEQTNVPRTTAVRWLREMKRHGLVTLGSDRHDKRLVRVAITQAATETMDNLLGKTDLSAE
jgi:DNA-binding MarR family transcriptional regulator